MVVLPEPVGPQQRKHPVGLGDDPADLGDHLGAEPDLVERPTADALSRIRMTIFSPDFEPEVATRKSISRRFELGAERAVLRLPFLRDVHRRQDLEHVQDGVAGGAVERLGGVEDAVDPVANRELLGASVRGGCRSLAGARRRTPVPSRRCRTSTPRPWTRSGSAFWAPWLLPTKMIGGPVLSTPSSPLLKTPRIPILVHQAVGDLAEVIGREHLVLVGHGLIADVDISEAAG